MKPFSASFALNSSRGNGDGFASWMLSEDSWLGLVADAPSAAAPGSAMALSGIVSDWIESRGRPHLCSFAEAGGGAELLSGLLAHSHEQLVGKSGDHWVAAVFALVSRDSVALAGRGDCAAYLQFAGGAVFRYSDTTTIEGGGILPAAPGSAAATVVHRAEGVYLGAGERGDHEGLSFRRESVRRLLLMSDGFEECLGVTEIARRISGSEDADYDEKSFSIAVQEKELKDDTTFLGLILPPVLSVPERGTSGVAPSQAGVGPVLRGASPTESETVSETGNPGSVIPEDDSAKAPEPDHDAAGTPEKRENSLTRRFLGCFLSILSVTLVGGLLWFIIHLYLEEVREELPPEEKNSEILSSEPENPE